MDIGSNLPRPTSALIGFPFDSPTESTRLLWFVAQVAKRSAIGEVLLTIRLGSSFCCAPTQYPLSKPRTFETPVVAPSLRLRFGARYLTGPALSARRKPRTNTHLRLKGMLSTGLLASITATAAVAVGAAHLVHLRFKLSGSN